MLGSLAILAYWPIVNLTAIYVGRNDLALHLEKYISYPIVLGIITVYALLGMWYLYKNQKTLVE